MEWNWIYTVAGLSVGFIVGMTGVGGGSLMTPLLVLIFGFAPSTAVGTDLLYAAITKMGGVFVHARKKTVDWKIAGLLMLGSVPASVATITLVKSLNIDPKQFDKIIMHTLGVALILTAIAILGKPHLHRFGETKHADFLQKLKPFRAIVTVLVGLFLGSVVTLTSVGAGALGAAILFFLYPYMATVRIVGTDLLHAVPLTLTAGLGHLSMGTVNLPLLVNLLIGSLPGIYLGSQIATRVPDRILRPALAMMLVIIGTKLLL